MRISVNGTVLNCETTGAGDLALVFLHPFGGSHRIWNGVTPLLSEKYRCVAPDLRGWGDSEAPAAGYSVDDYADDVIALIREMDLRHYTVVGHSMGGKVAVALAARQPPGLRALALVAPSPPTPEPMKDAERTRLLAAHGNRGDAEKTVRKITPHPLSDALFERTVEDYVRASEPAWRSWLEEGSRENIVSRLEGIIVPVHIVVGANDPVVPPQLLRSEIVDHISQARIRVVPEAGHLLPLENPEATVSVIRQAVSQVPMG